MVYFKDRGMIVLIPTRANTPSSVIDLMQKHEKQLLHSNALHYETFLQLYLLLSIPVSHLSNISIHYFFLREANLKMTLLKKSCNSSIE